MARARKAKPALSAVDVEVKRLERRRAALLKRHKDVEDHWRTTWEPKLTKLNKEIAGVDEVLRKLRG